jgi:hypothetical protein
MLVMSAALACAAPAPAASVTLTGGTLRIADTRGEPNVLSVEPSALGVDVYDDASALQAGEGCLPLARDHALCTAMTAPVSIEIAAGRGGDLVDLRRATQPVVVDGGTGDDLVEGGAANDRLDGRAGIDTVIAGAGDDRLGGQGGTDLLQGGDGADTAEGGASDDILEGEGGDGDVLLGGDGADLMRGGDGTDTLKGEDGDDSLIGGAGRDSMATGRGKDEVFAADGERDEIDCRPGDDGRVDRQDAATGCEPPPTTARAPVVWPPPSSTARAAIRGRRGKPSGRVLTPRDPERVAFRIPAPRAFKVAARFQILSARGRPLTRPVRRVVTARLRQILPLRLPRRARRVRVTCCG